MMRFASLGSGSKGNATLVEAGNTCVLIDCGFSVKEAVTRLERRGVNAGQLSAIIVTHEHGDHMRGVGPLARKYGIPVWMTRGTARHNQFGRIDELNFIDVHHAFEIDDLYIQPFPVPHDAREPCQFVFSDGNRRLGLLTDTGSITRHIEEQLSCCEALILECNYDEAMLADGPYPPTLKQRVAGRFGHLSNRQAVGLLGKLDTDRLEHLVAAHLSEQNNDVELVRDELSNAIGCDGEWIGIAEQDTGLDWRKL